MADAKKASQRAEEQFDRVAEAVKEKFDRITGGALGDQVDKGIDRGRDQARRKEHGESAG